MNEYFDYLDKVRECGQSDFSAMTQLENRFGFEHEVSAVVLSLWAKSRG